LKKNKEYDLELANFIKSKYDIFCEKRWKYIIEYNQIIKTYSKKKKERELTRILDQIGMKKLLNEDCLP
jgi:c-di-GMP-related signal transduction protein